MSKAKREYVVGYRGEQECVYGPDERGPLGSTAQFVSRMNRKQAERQAGKLNATSESVVCIYRLVPVATGRVVNGKFVERKKAKKKAAPRAKAMQRGRSA